MFESAPALGEIDTLTPFAWSEYGETGEMDSAPFESPITNFYMTDPISRIQNDGRGTERSSEGQKTGTNG